MPHAGYDGLKILDKLPDPTDGEAWQRTLDCFYADGITHLIIDNLMRFVCGADINSQATLEPALRRLDEVGRRGIPVLVVHHAAAPGLHGASRRPMGHQAINAASRLTVHVDALSGSHKLQTQPNRSASVTIQMKVDFEHLTAEVIAEGEAARSPRQRDMGAYRTKAKRLLAAPSVDDRASQAALGRKAAELGLAAGDGRDLIRTLLAIGILAKEGSGTEVGPGPNFEGFASA